MQKSIKSLTRLGGYLDSIERELEVLRGEANEWPPDGPGHSKLSDLERQFAQLDRALTELGTAVSGHLKSLARDADEDSWEDVVNFFTMPTREERVPPELAEPITPPRARDAGLDIHNAGTRVVASAANPPTPGRKDREPTETDPMFQQQAAEILRRALREDT